MSDGDSSTPASGSSSAESEPHHATLNDSDSHDESSDDSYILSTCCECGGQLEDRSVDIPILLCDGCGNECHLTCAKDQPNLTRIPEGEWYCFKCVRKQEEKVSAATGGADSIDIMKEHQPTSKPWAEINPQGLGIKTKISPGNDRASSTSNLHLDVDDGGVDISSNGQTLSSEQFREERRKNIRLHIKLVEHAVRCGANSGGGRRRRRPGKYSLSDDANCSSANCKKMKGYLQHFATCQIRAWGGCKICTRIWTLVRIHAEQCNKAQGCLFPHCESIKTELWRRVGARSSNSGNGSAEQQKSVSAQVREAFLNSIALKVQAVDKSTDLFLLSESTCSKAQAVSPSASEQGIDLEVVPFDELEEAYTRRKKRKELMAVLESVPFDMLEESYKKRKRLMSTINLTSDEIGEVQSDGSCVALQSQMEQQHAFLNVKKEQTIEISHLKGKIEEEKKTSAAYQLNFDRMKECVVCQDADRCVALFPCSHLALCTACQYLVEDCPICREKIEERKTIKIA